MTAVSWRKTLLRCLAAFFLILLISIVIEGIAIRREIGEMTTATRVAANGSLVRFSNLEFAADDFKDYAYSSELYNIKDSDTYANYTSYLTKIETAAVNKGIYRNGSDIKVILAQLKKSADDFRTGKADFCYTPMQFGYSFLDADVLEELFNEDIASVVEANYHQDTAKQTNMYTLAFSGMDRVRLTGVDVIVTDPVLLYESDAENDRTFKALFGSDRTQAIEMTGNHESVLQEYDYVIAYDVQYVVHWEHETITPMFRNWNITKDRIGSDYLNENNQLRVEMNDIVFEKRYILTN